eukprot:SAG11_NODE_2898_length_2851_cov_3.351381_4_plen_206_part_00
MAAAATAEPRLVWTSADALEPEGLGWAAAKRKTFYDRFPSKAEATVPPPVWGLSTDSAGVAARFVTDSPEIRCRWSLRKPVLAMVHMPATGVSGVDLYARAPDGSWRWVAGGGPTQQEGNEITLVAETQGFPPGEHGGPNCNCNWGPSIRALTACVTAQSSCCTYRCITASRPARSGRPEGSRSPRRCPAPRGVRSCSTALLSRR